MFGFGAKKQRRQTAGRRCAIEQLERRELLSATDLSGLIAHPLVARPAANSGPGYSTPAQIRHAYGFDRVTRFGGAAANGAGQTIAIVDAFDHPTIARALAAFDAAFGLAAPPSFRKVDQRGGTHYPPADPGWSVEIALDVEWAHAAAPGANILLVEADSDQLDDLLAAVDYARRQPGVSVVSMSWGLDEFQDETLLDGYFTTPSGHQGVTFIAASGDGGAPANWPATSAGVLAAGGTTLRTAGSAANYRGESAWSGSGGGISAYEKAPACQRAVQTTGRRTTPDVAYNSDPRTGFIVYDSTPGVGWIIVGGTSAAAPQWAGIVAIANQGRAAARVGSLRGGPADLYQLPAADFHDVAAGTNGFSAVPGYDFVTGRGTPYVDRVVRDLVALGSKPPAATSRIRRLDLGWAVATSMAVPGASRCLNEPGTCAMETVPICVQREWERPFPGRDSELPSSCRATESTSSLHLHVFYARPRRTGISDPAAWWSAEPGLPSGWPSPVK